MQAKHHNSHRRRSARHSCRDSLSALIKEVNLLPHGFVVPVETFRRRNGSLNLVLCQEFFDSLPENLQRYLNESPDGRHFAETKEALTLHLKTVSWAHGIRSRYMFGSLVARSYWAILRRAVNAKRMFEALIEIAAVAANDFENNQPDTGWIPIGHFSAMDPGEFEDKISGIHLSLNRDYEIRFELSEWATLLQGVDISRLRKCEICSAYFWAARKDAYTCSKQHAKVRQMRLLRKKWQENGELYLRARRKTTMTKRRNR